MIILLTLGYSVCYAKIISHFSIPSSSHLHLNRPLQPYLLLSPLFENEVDLIVCVAQVDVQNSSTSPSNKSEMKKNIP